MHARTHLSHCPWKQKLLQHTRCGWWFFYLHSEQDTTSEKSHPFPLPLPLHFLLLPLYPSPKQCQSTGFIHALYSKCWSSSNEAACAIIKLIGMTWPRSEWIRQLSRLRVDTLTTTPLKLFCFFFFVFLTDSQKPSTVLRIRYQRWVTSKDVCKETVKVGSIQTPAQQVGSASQQMLSQAAQVKCWGRKESFV